MKITSTPMAPASMSFADAPIEKLLKLVGLEQAVYYIKLRDGSTLRIDSSGLKSLELRTPPFTTTREVEVTNDLVTISN